MSIYIQNWNFVNDSKLQSLFVNNQKNFKQENFVANCFKFFLPTAVKCNPNPTIIKTLAALGANFDCASKVI